MKSKVILLIILIGFNLGLTQNYSGWVHNASITINTTPLGANINSSLTNFPILVKLYGGTSFDFSQAQSSGEDIRFENASGQILKYQIDTWDAVSQVASIWVKIPSIKGNSTQDINIYWGKADAISESDGAVVFDTTDGFAGVWHLNESSSNTVDGYQDATLNQSHGQGESMESIGPSAGVIGKAAKFNSTKKQRILIYKEEPFRFTRSMTISVWILHNQLGNQGFENIITKSHSSWELGRHGQNQAVYCRMVGHGNADINGSAAACDETWHYVNVVYTGDNRSIYVDGELDVTQATGTDGPLGSRDDPVVMGWNSPIFGESFDGRSWNGLIDEARLSPVARSADWIRMNYQNQKYNQSVVSIPKSPGCVEDFGIANATFTANEGQPLIIPFKAVCATSLYWTDVSNTPLIGDLPRIIGSKRISKDSTFTLKLNALYGTTWRTDEVAVTLKVAVPQPDFELTAPPTWDGVTALEIKPTINNLTAIQNAPSPFNVINYDWNITKLGVSRTITPQSLILNGAHASPLSVELCLNNGGNKVCKSVNLTAGNVVANPTTLEKTPLKVFILAGQSNMEGHGVIDISPTSPTAKGSMEYYVLNAPNTDTYKHTVDASKGGWRERNDVWIYYNGETVGEKAGNLSPYYGVHVDKMGPDFQFGHRMGDYYDNQVLLIKIALGGRSLAKHWLSPSSPGFDTSLAGIWDPGYGYKRLKGDVQKVLGNIKTYFPAYDDGGYEVVGMGWHQGWNDHLDPQSVADYPRNLANLVKDLRVEYSSPEMLFAIADNGNICQPGEVGVKVAFCDSQRVISTWPEFDGTVAAINTTTFWVPGEDSPGGGGFHWNGNGGSYYNIGNALGNAMISLISKNPVKNNFPNEDENKKVSNNIIFSISNGRQWKISSLVEEIIIHNTRGKLITNIPVFTSRVLWSGNDKLNRPVSNGIYFARLRSARNTRSIKLLMVR